MSLRNRISGYVFGWINYLLSWWRYISFGFRRAHAIKPLRTFARSQHQVFFGYYDVTPFNHNDSILLATAAPAANEAPRANTKLELGYYRLDEDAPEFQSIAVTTAWCWQQGCRYQWFPPNSHGRNHQVIFNDFDGERYISRVLDIETRAEVRRYDLPVYSLTHDGRYAFTLDFARLGRLRPGYGYACLPDASKGDPAPQNEGIRRIDLRSGETKLLLSVRDAAALAPTTTSDIANAEHYLNHISVNPHADVMLFFHIRIENRKRKTRLIISDLDGRNSRVLIHHGNVAHYAWKNAHELLCYSRHDDGEDRSPHYHLYDLRNDTYEIVGRKVLPDDGHPSYFDNTRYILTDTYQDRYRYQNLLLYDAEQDRALRLGSFFASLQYRGDVKCDLHPRISPTGRQICIDSAHSGRRCVYILSADGLVPPPALPL